MTKTDKILNSVKQQILDGIYVPGDKFPGTRELAASHCVSYLTANNIMQRLESEGFITRYPRKGSFVSIPAIPAAKADTTIKAGYFVNTKESFFGEFFKEVLALTSGQDIFNIPLDMSLTSLATPPEKFQEWLKNTFSKNFDSITIYADRHFPYKELKKYEKQLKQINFIYYDNSAIEFPNANRFTVDMEEVGYIGASHLLQCGARKIFLDTVSNLTSSYRMQMGVKLEDHEYLIIKGIERAYRKYNLDFMKDFNSYSNRAMTESDYIHLMKDEKFDGFFSINNCHFEYIYYAAKALNLKMGKNIHCVETCNSIWHNIYTPPVSTISFNPVEIARLTAQAIIENQHGIHAKIKPIFIQRNPKGKTS